jgi:iron(III) transport system permease protein
MSTTAPASARRRVPLRWVGAGAIALLVVAPVLALAFAAAGGSEGLWSHLMQHVLPVAVRDTLILLLGVGLLSTAIGTGAAWLVAAYDFPVRRIFDWALLLPLAVPTYIIAYAYLDVLHPVGPVQSALRALLGYESPRDFRLPDVRSMLGCIVLLGFVLYPYVYLAARALFRMQAANFIEAARTLGVTRGQVFFRVALPLARPAVAMGASLVLLETLNDIGASEFLGVRTLTVSVYTTWVTRSDLAGAAQIALAMLAIVVALLLLERWARRQRRYANESRHLRPLAQYRLRGLKAAVASIACGIPVFVGFAVPASYLIVEAIERAQFAGVSQQLISEVFNTVTLSAIATVLTVLCALMVAYAARIARRRMDALTRVASLGYAIPGAVLATGILPIVTGLDAAIDSTAQHLFSKSTGLLRLGTGAAVVYAYVVRFLAVSAGSLEAGYARISQSLDGAARTLGATPTAVFWRVHFPLLRPALIAGALLVFVDCVKELPATLLLRPLGFETLSTHLYGEAARGTYEDASIAALLIVAVGLIPVMILLRLSDGPQRTATFSATPAESAR